MGWDGTVVLDGLGMRLDESPFAILHLWRAVTEPRTHDSIFGRKCRHSPDGMCGTNGPVRGHVGDLPPHPCGTPHPSAAHADMHRGAKEGAHGGGAGGGGGGVVVEARTGMQLVRGGGGGWSFWFVVF